MNEPDILKWMADKSAEVGMSLLADSHGKFIVFKGSVNGYGNTVEKALANYREKTEETRASLLRQIEELPN